MNTRQVYYDAVDSCPEEKLALLLGFFRDLKKLWEDTEEELDMAYCVALAERHDKCDDKYERGISIQELAAKLGVDLEGERDYDDD